MTKDYYLILGIPAGASREDIQAAFRRRSLELHPDRSGLGSGPFREVQEGYSVLGDAERRRVYDRERRWPPVRHRDYGPPPEPLGSARRRAETTRVSRLMPACRELTLTNSFATCRPSFAELFDRLWANFEPVSRPKSESSVSLTVEVVLDSEDAFWGGQVRVWVPARARCPACGGHGAVGPYECWQCEGHGALTADLPVDVAYPAAVRDGYVVTVPLAGLGIHNLHLTVLFRVGAGTAG